MCVYSVAAKNTREFDAQKGERLVITGFSHTKGFADPSHPQRAVCMRDGSEIEIIAPQQYEFLNALMTARARLVEGDRDDFPMIGREYKHDELEFEGGIRYRLKDLPTGMVVNVVSVPAAKTEQKAQTTEETRGIEETLEVPVLVPVRSQRPLNVGA